MYHVQQRPQDSTTVGQDADAEGERDYEVG